MPATRGFLVPDARTAPAAGLFDAGDYADVAAFFDGRRDLRPTPLRSLPELARAVGVARIDVKDEGQRFGLNAFKLLGVVYAVDRLRRAGLRRDAILVCATSGNHGRAVARAARLHDLQARVFLPDFTAPARVDAIAREGATVVRVAGSYEDAVRAAAAEAEREPRAVVVSDTAWPGYDTIPRWIMAGYTRLMDEAFDDWHSAGPPDVVVVQCGVGGLAGAVASWLAYRFGPSRPFLIIAEPAEAACALESAKAGHAVSLQGELPTVMSGLRCAELSTLAWPVLSTIPDAFVAVEDRLAEKAMRLAARSGAVAGASGACGLGALLAIADDSRLDAIRRAAKWSARSRVFGIVTEGATDPAHYAAVVSAGR